MGRKVALEIWELLLPVAARWATIMEGPRNAVGHIYAPPGVW